MFDHEKRLKFGRAAVVALACLTSAGLHAAGANACQPTPEAGVVYVDQRATGAGNGTSWSDAFTDLHAALDAAASSAGPDQVWIARGSYVAGAATPFVVPADTRLYGGFRGREQHLAQRDPARHKTVLEGAGVARHVVLVSGAQGVGLDGLTVTGGAATGDLAQDALDATNEVRGGGLLAFDSDLALCDVELRGNQARKFGGALYQRGGSLRVRGGVFSHNAVLRGPQEVHDEDAEADTDGGGLAIHAATLLDVQGTLFADNVAGDDGGALASRDVDDTRLVGARFLRNKGIAVVRPIALAPGASARDILISTMGGAVQLWNEYVGFNNGLQAKRVLLRDCEFADNRGAIAAGAYIESTPGSVTVVENSRFLRNGGSGQADPGAPAGEQGVVFGRSGGALMIVGLRWGDREEDAPGHYLHPQHKAVVRGCTFADNQAGYAGAMQFIGIDGDLQGNAFLRNLGRQRGGALLFSNVFSLFDQLNGLRPGLGSVRVERNLFFDNRALGQPESLLAEEFPGLMTDLEQPTGGGAIFTEADYDLRVSDSLFVGNSSSDGDGGAIHASSIHLWFFVFAPGAPTDYGSRLEVRGSGFYGNRVLGSGGGGALAVGGSQAGGLIGDAFGNDVRDVGAPSSALLVDSLFEWNSAAGDGGAAVVWNASELTLQDSRMTNNTAAGNGGALGALGRTAARASLSVDGSTLRDNVAGGLGGGVYASASDGALGVNQISGNAPNDVEWLP